MWEQEKSANQLKEKICKQTQRETTEKRGKIKTEEVVIKKAVKLN